MKKNQYKFMLLIFLLLKKHLWMLHNKKQELQIKLILWKPKVLRLQQHQEEYLISFPASPMPSASGSIPKIIAIVK